MPTVNVPFELEPWCEGCPHLDQMRSVRSYDSYEVKTVRCCTHLLECRWAVASARKLDKGGDADA